MLNNIKKILFFVFAGAFLTTGVSYAAEELEVDIDMEDVSANAVANYDVDGSLFQQITNLEQEKVLMQLEKERAQLDLDLDRLAAEKIKLHMEIDALSGRAETQQQELEVQMAKLEAESSRLAREKEDLEKRVASGESVSQEEKAPAKKATTEENPITKKYKLVNVIGAGTQLQATVADLATGQNKRISVGRVLDGYVVKSISLDEGVVLVKGSDTQSLHVTNGK